jgi:hypothetical protein
MPKDSEKSKVIAEFVSKYFGGTLEQGMGIVEDKLAFMRWERKLRLIDRSKEILKERGIDEPTKSIPYKFSVPLLEAATLEEDNYLQDKWALLLANAVDSNIEFDIKRVHISILENLTGFEVKLFSEIAENELKQVAEGNRPTVNLVAYPVIASPGTTEYEAKGEFPAGVEAALNNIVRLGLLYNDTFGASSPNFVCLSALGKEFYSACS